MEIIVPVNKITKGLKNNLFFNTDDRFLSFGWGDKNFYLNTPTWDDLTFKNAANALLLNSSTLIHVTRFRKTQTDWIMVKLSEDQLERLNAYIQSYFVIDPNGNKIQLFGKGYGKHDEFYESKESYSCLKTCNTWVNDAFMASNLKSCLWTPYDFRLLDIYK